jgi:capsular exopolysaccharide synthesis family protein
MSRIFEALQKSNAELGNAPAPPPEAAADASDLLQQVPHDSLQLDQCATFAIPAVPQNRIVMLTDGKGLGAEKIRVLSTKLRHLRQKRRLSRLLVTSCMKGEGKSVVASNLAIALAKHGKVPVLLIDGDFRLPGLSRIMGLENGTGVSTWWANNTPPQQLLRRASDLPLWFLAAGQPAEQPLEILQSRRLADLLNLLSARFEWVIIDSPPYSPLADSSVWATLVDGAIFVVRENWTPAKVLQKALQSVDASKLVGLVMNESSVSEHRYYDQYYYGYGSKK